MNRIAMSPRTRAAMNPHILSLLESRAGLLGVQVSTSAIGRTWTAKAFSRTLSASHSSRSFVGAIDGALDAYSDLLFSADELVTIARQTEGL